MLLLGVMIGWGLSGRSNAEEISRLRRQIDEREQAEAKVRLAGSQKEPT